MCRLILLALLGGHCHAFSSMHHGHRQRLKTPLAMAPPVAQEELNGGSIIKVTPSEEAVVPDLVVEAELPIMATSIILTPSATNRQLPSNWLGEKLYILSTAALIGILTGTNIAVFKTAVELVREALYGDGIILPFLNPTLWNELKGEEILTITLRTSETIPIWLIPAFGGILVGLLLKIGEMPPGLRDTVKEVDLDSMIATNATLPDDLLACVDLTPAPQRNDFARFSRKALAATVTLGTGNSLGPEGPSVEAGMSLSRLLMNNKIFEKVSWVFGTLEDMELSEVQRVNRKVARDRLLLACGAAAGVSAGFNAPLSGVFFALEIVQNSLVPIDFPLKQGANISLNAEQKSEIQVATVGGEALALQQINISAILLASVVSALTIQLLLGNELALRLGSFDFKNPLIELPLYLLLGAFAGITAALFSGVAQLSKSMFDGEEGPEIVRDVFKGIPKYAKPVIASLFCGIVSLFVPQVLFFGYETLNGLFLNSNFFSTEYLLVLLAAKLMTTAVSASSGLVGGTFAPSLFLGGVLGAGFHNVVADSLQVLVQQHPELSAYPIVQGISGLPAFAMVGAASVLAALFRAPLTASLLLFECTRNYDVILPLMASAGVASLTGDIVEKWLDEEQRDKDPVSWGDLATRLYEDVDDDALCIVNDDKEYK
eukprot:scaffold3122_cov207-Skeletonema_menzelii.AAC.9